MEHQKGTGIEDGCGSHSNAIRNRPPPGDDYKEMVVSGNYFFLEWKVGKCSLSKMDLKHSPESLLQGP